MRILHVDSERSWRGGERQVLLLASGLRERGHDTIVAAPPGAALLERCSREGLATAALPLRHEISLPGAFALARLARDFSAQIVHAHSSHSHLLASLACRLAPAALCVVSRRVDFPIGRISARLKYGFGVTRYIAISAAVAGVLREAGIPDLRISVVRSGIDPGRLAGADGHRGRQGLTIPPTVPLVGTVSHLAGHKGLIHLILAWPRVLARVPDAHLVIIGRGEEEQRLRAAAEATGAGASIHFSGFRDDIADCLAALDVFVMPSVMEGMGTSLLDALALERPVVASRVGGIPEVIRHGENGLLVPPGDPLPLATAIGNLLLDRPYALAMARRGRERVLSELTSEAMVEGTEAVYREILGEL